MKTGISVKWRAPCGRHAAAAATATGYHMKILRAPRKNTHKNTHCPITFLSVAYKKKKYNKYKV